MPRRNRADAVADRRANVARLYCLGHTQAKIAAQVGVCQQQISDDLAVIRATWQRTMVEEFDRLKAEQLAKIDAAESQAWRGWRRSLRDAQKKTTKDAVGGVETSETVEGQAGDPRFLNTVINCVERRCKLIGADAPAEQKLTGTVRMALTEEIVDAPAAGHDPQNDPPAPGAV